VKEAQASLRIAQAGARVQLATKERATAEIAAARMARNVAQANQAALKAKLEETEREVQRKLILARTANVSKADLTGTQARRDAETADVLAATEQIKVKDEAIVVAEADLRIAEANLDNAEAIVEEKQAALEQAEQDLARTEIRSPIDGVVIKRDINPGQTVEVSLEAKTLFDIANDLHEMEVHGKLDEADIGQVKPGQKATFTVDAYPNHLFTADVRQVRMAHEVVQNVVTYTVIISARNPELLLFPGMTANLIIRIDESAEVLKIPNQALRFKPDGEARTAENPDMNSGLVWVEDPKQRAVPVQVTLGRSDSNGTELRSGNLSEGQPVIVGIASGDEGTGPLGLRLGF
jgi:HlyD family secretion protein